MNEQIQPKKSSLAKFWWIFLIIIVLGLSAKYVIDKKNNNHEQNLGDNGEKKTDEKKNDSLSFAWPGTTAKYITAVPVDLTQIQSISKYRSCAGHIRDGYNFEQQLEDDRSMKHYLFPTSEFQGTMDKVKMFAPFDGTIISLDLEKDKVGGRPNNGNGIHLGTSVDPNVLFGFGHLYFVKDFKVGDKVKAGELLGYAALGDKGNDFDIDLNTPGSTSAYNGREVLGSAFDHMTESVLAEFAKYGITPDNTKFTKEYRDADPCNYPTPDSSHNGRENNDWMQLKH